MSKAKFNPSDVISLRYMMQCEAIDGKWVNFGSHAEKEAARAEAKEFETIRPCRVIDRQTGNVVYPESKTALA